MIGWLAYLIPWQAWLVIGLVVALVVYRLLGWKDSLAALGLVGTIVLTIRGQQAGKDYQLKKDIADAQKAIDKARAARAAADRINADSNRLRQHDENERR